MNVLLIEDDAATRLLLERFLARRGHAVTACADAESAWGCYEREPYPLVVTDYLLPGMDGCELCERLRTLPRGSQSVIVVCTARADQDSLERMLKAGADDYLVKPLDLRMLSVRLMIAEREVVARIERNRLELAIARSVIVDKHEGTLGFETESGKGTTFIIRLPVGGERSVAGSSDSEASEPSDHRSEEA